MSGGLYSVQAWVYRTSNLYSDWCAVSMGRWSGGCVGMGLLGVDSQWAFAGGSCQAYYTVDQFANEWVHIVGVVSNGTGYLYQNGVQVSSASMSVTPDNSPINLGRLITDNALYVGAKLDEVVIWNRSLSGSEVAALYNGGEGYYLNSDDPIATASIAIYHMDEGTGTSLANDSTHGGLAMTAYNGPTWTEGIVPGLFSAASQIITSAVINVDFVPSTVRGIVMTKAEVPLDTNDLALAVSRDNGNTWSEVELAESAYPSGDSTYQLFSGPVSVASQPSGTQLVFRVTQGNSAQTLAGLGGSWR
jgi:hypothetical protein